MLSVSADLLTYKPKKGLVFPLKKAQTLEQCLQQLSNF
jgi:hypothetical protein